MECICINDRHDNKYPFSREVFEDRKILYHGTWSTQCVGIESEGLVPSAQLFDEAPFLTITNARKSIGHLDSYFPNVYKREQMKTSSASFLYFASSFWGAKEYATNGGGEVIAETIKDAQDFERFFEEREARAALLKLWEDGLLKSPDHEPTKEAVKLLRNDALMHQLYDEVVKARKTLETITGNGYPVVYAVLVDPVWFGDEWDSYLSKWKYGNDTSVLQCFGCRITPERLMGKVEYPNGTDLFHCFDGCTTWSELLEIGRSTNLVWLRSILIRKEPKMHDIGKPERVTQNRAIKLFVDELDYRYLGDWTDRDNNSNVEEGILSSWLAKRGNTPAQINAALYKLRTEADDHSRDLYENNKEVYKLLRYGVQVKTEASEPTATVQLIDWTEPEKNDFAIAEEVTLKGNHERRPDLVLYVNGIAVGVIELKCSRVSIGDGIRQNLSNQQPEFNAWFFSTVQFIFAGNDSEGLQYGSILTPEKYFLRWKEDEEDNSRFKLDKYLLKMCNKDLLIELMHDFVLFDSGIKKLPRVHQYFGIKAAQEHVRQKKGGIIWHTQGSGKSIVMVLLAKWILENNPNARVALITDRDELDKQIEGVFTEAGEPIKRTTSGIDLMSQLGQATPRLMCSLVHKFGRRDVDDFDAFIKDLEAQPSQTVGEVFVFVDECHRTQSGKLHKVMKAMMPNAVFIGFTGTPLLKKDKVTSLEVFGGYIHTYKFSEAVADEVVLDLIYEARDIDQHLGSQDKIDAWFEAKTKGLNDWQKEELKKQWGTMQHVLSSRSRMDRVVDDIIFDFSVKPRLSSERGNALLVASSIYEACKYFTLFQKGPLKGKCAVITSYNPLARDITLEETGANTETDKQFIYNTYAELLKDVEATPGMNKTETYEESAKAKFIKEPANMKLLVVVDKLLTGFDVPPCTYLYIDKSMQDHGLFQAICRTNRLDGDDKDFGYIVDYKDLFKKVENAIAVYTSELDHSSGGADPEVLLQDRLKKGKERLDNAIEALVLLCEPVEPPKGELEHIHYFCGNTEVPSYLEDRQPQRAALYKAAVALVRAYANIADDLDRAGYSTDEISRISKQLNYYLDIREIVRKASGEQLDLKPYEADMRHLIDTYIEADEPRKISAFDNMGLLELIQKTGIANAITAQLSGMKGNTNAISETIENNVRSKIIKEHLNDPAFYETMSALLDEIIAARKAKAIEYEEYLKRIADLAAKVQAGLAAGTPEKLDTPGKRALWNNLGQNEELALKIDASVRHVRPDGWRGVQAREQVIKAAIYGVVQDQSEVERIFLIIKAQGEY